jgi:hypothetical protein
VAQTALVPVWPAITNGCEGVRHRSRPRIQKDSYEYFS